MSILWILLGIVLLVPAAWVGLIGLFWLIDMVMTSGLFEYLIWPAILASTVAGGWLILHLGLHVL